MNQNSRSVARLTGWSAIVGAILAVTTNVLWVAVVGSNTDILLHGPSMLALPVESRELFRWCMLTDTFGFYLPFLIIGGYFVHAFRDELGALGNMVMLAAGLYVTVGVVGAVIQLATIQPLAHLYAGGDEATRQTAASTWTTIANATQNGLWWVEGPLVLFWAPIAARVLKNAGWKGGVLLRIGSWSFGLWFLFGFFPALEVVSSTSEMVMTFVMPLWMLVFGWQLLRRSSAYVSATPGLAG